jgi:hypothetical protein
MTLPFFPGNRDRKWCVMPLVALLLFSGLVPFAVAGDKGNQNPSVLPPNSHPYGRSYGEWADAWWQWVCEIPASMNPLGDTTGEFAGVGQSGRVWFLAGSLWDVGQIVRHVEVPAGKALFFPIANSIWVNTPAYGDPPWSDDQEAFARAVVADQVESVSHLACKIDGRTVCHITAYRCQTPDDGEFMVTLSDDNIFFGVDAGTYGPSVADGYYLMLAPLSPGRHTIHITAGDDESVHVDVTYHLTVGRGR